MALHGRWWRIDSAGFLQNDAQADAIQAEFKPVIDEVIEACLNHIEQDIHSIYVSGSVARGLAIRGKSDLNILVVTEYLSDPELIMQNWIRPAEDRIAARYDSVSDVLIEICPQPWLLRDESEFSIGAFIVKTQSVCVWGSDISPDLPDYKITDRQIRIAIANDDTAQCKIYIDDFMQEATNEPLQTVRYWGTELCKNLIRVAYSLVMVDGEGYTRDLDISSSYFLEKFPDQQDNIDTLIRYLEEPTFTYEDIIRMIDTFGAWLLDQCEIWLDQHNPERDLDYSFGDDE